VLAGVLAVSLLAWSSHLDSRREARDAQREEELQRREDALELERRALDDARVVRQDRLDNLRLLKEVLADPNGDRDFHGLDLRGMSLRRLDLSNVDLSGADLSGADLSGVTALNARFQGTNLSDAELSSAVFRDSEFIDADLDRALVRYAEFYGSTLSWVSLRNATVIHVRFDDTTLAGLDASGARLHGVQFWGGSIVDADPPTFLTESAWTGTTISGAFTIDAAIVDAEPLATWCWLDERPVVRVSDGSVEAAGIPSCEQVGFADTPDWVRGYEYEELGN
jgi:uncharacterized protein YjbI with pentapeptide repeats